jgi:hypothetical protein
VQVDFGNWLPVDNIQVDVEKMDGGMDWIYVT